MLSTAFIGAGRCHSSTMDLTSTTQSTLGQAGTTIAAAKYGMNPIDPVAETGSRNANNSAEMANAQRISASESISGGTAGECQ